MIRRPILAPSLISTYPRFSASSCNADLIAPQSPVLAPLDNSPLSPPIGPNSITPLWPLYCSDRLSFAAMENVFSVGCVCQLIATLNVFHVSLDPMRHQRIRCFPTWIPSTTDGCAVRPSVSDVERKTTKNEIQDEKLTVTVEGLQEACSLMRTEHISVLRTPLLARHRGITQMPVV